MNDKIALSVDCGGTKYTVQQLEGGGVRALRYGEPWRDCIGDGLILTLAQELDEARKEVEFWKKKCNELKQYAPPRRTITQPSA